MNYHGEHFIIIGFNWFRDYYKRFLESFTIIIVIFLFIISLKTSADEERFTGYKPATPEEKEFIKQMTYGELPTAKSYKEKTGKNLPSTHKNVLYLPRIRTQLLSNCGAFAPTYYIKTWQEAKEHGWVRPDPYVDPEHIMSPGFTFPLGNAGKNEGANPLHIMSIICRYGCATWKEMPESYDYTKYPDESQWRSAMKYRGDYVLPPFNFSNDLELESIKAHLAGGNLLCSSMPLYKDPFEYYPSVSPDGDYPNVSKGVIFNHGPNEYIGLGPHAFTLIGYDDNKEYNDNGTQKKGAFLAVNSWGEGWGVWDNDLGTTSGVWFAYEYFKVGFPQVMEVVGMVDRIGYEPTDVAVIDLSHPLREELKIKIYAGNKDNPPMSPMDAFPTAGSMLPYTGRIVLDVTDFSLINPYAYWLKIQDQYYDSWGINTGEIRFFQIQKLSDPTTYTATMTPLATVDAYDTGDFQYLYAGIYNTSNEFFEDICEKSFKASWGDINGDGWIDLALIGSGDFPSNTNLSKLYRNDSGLFSEISSPIPNIAYGNVTFGDYNRDRLLDLAVCGTSEETGITKIFKYCGFNNFSDINASLSAYGEGASLAWGDYDNDGDVDLAMSGSPTSGKSTALFRNDNGTFNDSGINLPQMPFAQISWADFDNDGYLDLIIGNEIHNNKGDGTFRLGNIVGIEWFNSAHVVGDFNNDGLLDIIASGKKLDGSEKYTTLYYKNDGNFFLTEQIDSGLPSLNIASLAAADFNNDGRLDVALCGYTAMTSSDKITRIYQQLPDGKFVDLGADIPGLSGGNLTWIDFDRDGDMDLLASGMLPAASGVKGFTKLYINNKIEENGMNFINQKPSIPIGLNTSQGNTANEIILQWAPAIDDKTPANSIQYNIRIGTTAERANILSPASEKKLLGNCGLNRIDTNKPGLILKNLPAGRYFWAVQSQDAGFETSDWSNETVFVIGTNGIINPDVNNDGKIDIGDVVKCSNLISQDLNNDSYDFNGDGLVDSLDPFYIASKILGNETKGYQDTASVVIGSSGGKIEGHNFEMNIPAGAFASDNIINLSVSAFDMPFGDHAMPLSYKITGFPDSFAQPITVRIKDTRPDQSTDPFIAFGEPRFSQGSGEVTLNFKSIKCTKSVDGFATYQIPERPGNGRNISADSDDFFMMQLIKEPYVEEEKTLEIKTKAAPVRIKIIISGWLWYQWSFNDMMQVSLNALKRASQMGFDLTKRDWFKYPLYIYVSNLGKMENTNEYLPGLTEQSDGTNNGSIIYIGSGIVNASSTELIKASVAHETFHVVENLYDPRDIQSRKKVAPEFLWLEEALSTWSEWQFVSNPISWHPETFKGNFKLLAQGFDKVRMNLASGNYKYSQNYGYAFAALMQYLIDKNNGDEQIIVDLFNNILNKDNSLDAVSKLLQNAYPYEWFENTIGCYMLAKFGIGDDQPTIFLDNVIKCFNEEIGRSKSPYINKKLLYKCEIRNKDEISFQLAPTFLSEISFRAYITSVFTIQPNLTNTSRLAYLVKTSGNQTKCHLYKFSLPYQSFQEISEFLTYYPGNPYNEWRADVPELKNLLEHKYSFPLTIFNLAAGNNYENEGPVKTDIYVAMIRDYESEPLKAFEVNPSVTLTSLPWPVFKSKGNFSLKNVSYCLQDFYDNGHGNASEFIKLECWGKNPDPLQLKYDCEVTTPTYKITYDDGSFDIYEMGDQFYRLIQYQIGKPWEPWEIISQYDNNTGNFNLPFDPKNDAVYYVLEKHYKYNWKYIDNLGNIIISKNPTGNFALISFLMYRK